MKYTIEDYKHLVSELNFHRNAYYNENKSYISDKEYDKLFDELVEAEEELGIAYANSPTQSVGYTVVSKLEKVKHNHPLLSLGKTTDIDEFRDYFGNKAVVLSAKLDGLTCSLLYENGELVRAESRGNGEIGEDITHNALTFINLPKTISYPGRLVIDGECIIDRATFDEINEKLALEAETPLKNVSDDAKTPWKNVIKQYKNPRNLVSGTVRQLDSKICAERKVKFIAWKLAEGSALSYFGDRLEWLISLGFEVVTCSPNLKYYDYKDGMSLYIDSIKDRCNRKGYPIDGIVGTFDDIAYGESLGMTSHHPRHSLAFKFYQERNETTLLDIEWATSRTGAVNPVAVFEAVEIDGTTVERASLSNVSIIKELELGVGDTIQVVKSNQIIPMITENLTRSGTYHIPTVCPDCGSPVEIGSESDREVLYCTNEKCPARVLDSLAHFCSREAMNIDGLSKEKLRMLIRYGFVTDMPSIFKLRQHTEELEFLAGFGKSSVKKMLDAIDTSRKCKFANTLVAIGVPGIGKSTAKLIAEHCRKENCNTLPSIGFLRMCDENHDWSEIDGIGTLTSDSINEYVREHSVEISNVFFSLCIEDNSCGEMEDIRLSGKTFCITGKLKVFLNRDQLIEHIERSGGKVVSGVTAKTDYLITNDKDSGSSKNKNAAKYGTKIISEVEFCDLVGLE